MTCITLTKSYSSEGKTQEKRAAGTEKQKSDTRQRKAKVFTVHGKITILFLSHFQLQRTSSSNTKIPSDFKGFQPLYFFFLEIFKNHLYTGMGRLLWVSLHEQGLYQAAPEVPANLNHSVMLF